MNKYLKILACLYFLGGVLHVLDLFDLRLKFSELENYWKSWISYLCIMDLITAVGLWRLKQWGIYCFLTVAISQLIAYIGFQSYFGNQYSLIVFHLVTILIFTMLRSGKLRNRTQI
jgi:uncharacterized membrane protein (DUF2068 family)